MKNLIIILTIIGFVSCTPKDLENILNAGLGTESALSQSDIANGLKEALKIGISNGSDKLSLKDGYLKSIHKIVLPEQAQKLVQRLSNIPGFTNIEEILVAKINHAAENAAIKAKPIFVNAITSMTFEDATKILMGQDNAATNYLNNKTFNGLYTAFKPEIKTSLNKLGALDYWTDLVNAYNNIPFVEKMNPSLDDHITNKALIGLFSMVEKEELGIRKDVNKRVSDLLKKVFAKQD